MNEQERKTLGEKVAVLRKARRLTQQHLADEAGVSLGVIGNLEGGKTVPQGANRRAIAKALGEDVFGDGTARAARDLWPTDVQIFTDVLGGYLARLDPETRAEQVADWMNEIVGRRTTSTRRPASHARHDRAERAGRRLPPQWVDGAVR